MIYIKVHGGLLSLELCCYVSHSPETPVGTSVGFCSVELPLGLLLCLAVNKAWRTALDLECAGIQSIRYQTLSRNSTSDAPFSEALNPPSEYFVTASHHQSFI